METKIYLPDNLASKWKMHSMKRFGYGRGSISKAAEEALNYWVAREESIEKTLERLGEIAVNTPGILALFLFGSYARKEIYNDVDVAVILSTEQGDTSSLKLLSELEGTISGEINFDISIFNTLDLEIRSRILSEGIPLYVKDRKKLYEISCSVIMEFSEYKILLDSVLGV